MRPMTWIPIVLDGGDTLAHLVLPCKLTTSELGNIEEVIRKLAPPVPPITPRTLPQAEPKPVMAPIRSELEREHRVVVDTATAASYLNRRPQTLRIWASRENGPMRPVRVNGRLAWSVVELRRCVGLAV
jgi:hypothetical protein